MDHHCLEERLKRQEICKFIVSVTCSDQLTFLSLAQFFVFAGINESEVCWEPGTNKIKCSCSCGLHKRASILCDQEPGMKWARATARVRVANYFVLIYIYFSSVSNLIYVKRTLDTSSKSHRMSK